ncbi:hypothetical protein Ddye_028651 [Dipteronia dyeriana]|uniref:Uncharacterized protein n=1 Tax=Dipteronia dyeriana TaxID=168575 RepID=A0AAD9TE33_9ROSI|nr:hypothetical protein Ddye_028651 [Dipteronia dyeriana]
MLGVNTIIDDITFTVENGEHFIYNITKKKDRQIYLKKRSEKKTSYLGITGNIKKYHRKYYIRGLLLHHLLIHFRSTPSPSISSPSSLPISSSSSYSSSSNLALR